MKRYVGTVLWFLAGYTLGSLLGYLFALPMDPVGLAVGLPIAAIVLFDPRGVVWGSRKDRRRVHSIEAFAESVERGAPKPQGTEQPGLN